MAREVDDMAASGCSPSLDGCGLTCVHRGGAMLTTQVTPRQTSASGCWAQVPVLDHVIAAMTIGRSPGPNARHHTVNAVKYDVNAQPTQDNHVRTTHAV